MFSSATIEVGKTAYFQCKYTKNIIEKNFFEIFLFFFYSEERRTHKKNYFF